MDAKFLATKNEILRGVVGSTAHGTGLDGQEDRDEMGICIEPTSYVCGLEKFEHYIFRTQPEGIRSSPGDLDLTVYSLRKFCALASRGNPSVIMLLWLPSYITQTKAGKRLVEMRNAFITRDAGWAYLGYLTSQRMGLTGERSKKVARPELVEQYGYDTKYAMHALRLGLQGIEYLTEFNISIPVKEPARTILRDVRSGKMPLSDVLSLISETEAQLRIITEQCSRTIDREAINFFMVEEHKHHWNMTRFDHR